MTNFSTSQLERIRTMELYRLIKGQYDDDHTALDVLSGMAELIDEGVNPEAILCDEGLEPDFVFELLDIYSMYSVEITSPKLLH